MAWLQEQALPLQIQHTTWQGATQEGRWLTWTILTTNLHPRPSKCCSAPLRREGLMSSLPTHPEHRPADQNPFESTGRRQKSFVPYTLPKAVYLELGFFFHPLRQDVRKETLAGLPVCFLSLIPSQNQSAPQSWQHTHTD